MPGGCGRVPLWNASRPSLSGKTWLTTGRSLPESVSPASRASCVLDGAQDSDDPGVVAALGMPMGLVAVPTGGVFVGGGTWPMTML